MFVLSVEERMVHWPTAYMMFISCFMVVVYWVHVWWYYNSN